jgi:4-hydroxy-tetrahydrodipicolinate reductase
MNIGIIGYGKMGREIEKIALQKGHNILLKINSKNHHLLNSKNIADIDVAIEFSTPETAFENIIFCINNKIPIVCGTTGWLNKLEEVKNLCLEHPTSFIYAPNFSIGVNLFFDINNYLSKLMSGKKYQFSVEETHHITKKDKPSGTAIKILNDILKNSPYIDNAHSQIQSHRIGETTGVHTIKYKSEIDEIELIHKAHNRLGFAEGALLAAEFIKNKTGFFTMKDIITNLK